MKIHREKLALFISGCSLLFHAVAVHALLNLPGESEFLVESIFFIAMAATTIVIELFITSQRLFYIIHAVRLAAITIVFMIFDGGNLYLYHFLSLPFVIETAIYLGLYNGIIINTLFLLILVLELAVFGDTTAISFMQLLSCAVVNAAAAGLGGLSVYYRETIVDNASRIKTLNTAVANLSKANRSFQQYADNVESATAERERNRITRELHDVTGYALTSIIMSLNAGKLLLDEEPDELRQLLEDTRVLGENALQESRVILYRLRSIPDEKAEGLHAIGHLISAFEKATGITVDSHYGNLPFSMGKTIDSILCRFIQEGLTNAFRHGKASRVRVSLWRTNAELTVSVRDNGRGAQNVAEGIGLRGMRERFESMKGSLMAANVIDGFEVKGIIPMEKHYGQDTGPDR